MEPGQDPNNFSTGQQPAPQPEIDVNLANPGQANNGYLNSQVPTSDTITAPAAAQPAPVASQPQPTAEPLQANIPPTMPPAAAPKSQIAWDRVALVGAGVIIIIALGAFLLLGNKKPAAKTPTTTPTQTQNQPTALAASKLQQTSDGTAAIAGGASYNQGKLTLGFDIAGTGTDIIPEVEVQPMGTAFTGTATAKGQAATAAADGTLQGTVVVTGLADGAYHWQARASQGSTKGDWASYGTDASAADFTIDTVAPAAPTVATIDATAVTAGQTVATTSNRPTFTGKADPNTALSIEVKPEGIKLSVTTDANGNWSTTANVDVPNGTHTLAVTSADAAGNTTSSTVVLGINTATTVATSPAAAVTDTTTTLAHTGEDTHTITLWALLAMVLSLAILTTVNRHARN